MIQVEGGLWSSRVSHLFCFAHPAQARVFSPFPFPPPPFWLFFFPTKPSCCPRIPVFFGRRVVAGRLLPGKLALFPPRHAASLPKIDRGQRSEGHRRRTASSVSRNPVAPMPDGHVPKLTKSFFFDWNCTRGPFFLQAPLLGRPAPRSRTADSFIMTAKSNSLRLQVLRESLPQGWCKKLLPT